MKRVLALIICLLLAFAATFIVACNKKDDNSSDNGSNNSGSNSDAGHVHTYSMEGEWEKDAAGHWLDATCDCDDVPVYKRAHVDANNDNNCDVCTYAIDAEHEHTHTEEWTADCTNHWNVADCGHTGAPVANKAAHTDADNDGECDVCKYVIQDLHNHYYSTEWTSGEGHHWHVALCEHGALVADKAACDVNDAGYCTICNAKVTDIDMTDLGKVLAAAVACNNKVVTGDVKLKETVYDGSEANNTLTVLSSAETGAFFVLGETESYYFLKNYNGNGELIGGEQQWYETLANGDIFGVKLNVNSYKLEHVMGDPAKLSGYTYMPGTILSAGYDDTNTLAQTLYNFYDLMTKGENVYDEAQSYDAETGYYTFSFAYYTVNENTSGGEVYDTQLALYETQILFSINDDYVIDYAEFEVKVYNFYDGGNVENDLTYDKETDTISKTASANPSYYNYIVHQTSGERTFTSPYPKESLVPIGFDFYYVSSHDFPNNATEWVIYEESLVEDVITLESGTYAYFHLGNPVPSITSFDFIDTADFSFTFVNNDPDSSKRAWYMDAGSVDEILNGYSSYIGCLKLKIRDAGEYTVTIGFGELSKTFTLVVTAPPTTEITGDAEKIDVILTDFNTYTNDDQAYTYVAAEEGNYTFTVPAGLGARLDGETNPKVDLYNNGGSFTVGLNAGESVKIYFAAGEYKQFTVNVSYVYADIPDPEPEPEEPEIELGDITGTYTASGLTVVIDDEKVTFTTSKGGQTVCEYDIIDGAVVLYNSYTGAPWSSTLLAVNISNGKVSDVVYNGSSYTVTKEGGEEPEPEPDNSKYQTVIVAGSNTLYFSAAEIEADAATRKVTITVAGNYSFSSGSLFVKSVTDAAGNTYSKNEDYTITLQPGEYNVNFSMLSMFGVAADSAQTLNLENKAPAGGEDDDSGETGETDELKASLHLFMPNNGTYDFMFLTTTEGYLVNIYNSAFDMYFTYELTDNGDGSYNMTATYFEREGFVYNAEYAAIVEETVFVLYYDGIEWSMESTGSSDGPATDPAKEAVLGYYTINGADVIVYQDYSTGEYIANIYGESFDLYFTFEVTDNYDGTYTLALTHVTTENDVGTDKVAEILAQEWVVSASSDSVEGSAENPYTIAEPGEYYAFFPEGYDPIWFAYYVTESGYITISTEYANPWFQYGTDTMNVANNQTESGIAQTVTFYAFAGQTVYVSVGDYDFVEAEVEFSFAFEAFESESSEHLVGTWNGAEASMIGSIDYTFIVNAEGTGTGSANYGYYTENFDITSILVNGTTVTFYTVTTGDWGGSKYTYTFTYDAEAATLTSDTMVLTVSETVPSEDVEEPSFDYNAALVEGANTVYLSADDIAANTTTRKLVITKDGVYKLSSGSLFISKVVDANGNPIEKVDYAYTLVAGEYTVTLANLSMFGASADTPIALNVVDQTPAPVEPEPEEPTPEEPTPDAPSTEITGSGTKADPYVVVAVPGTITFEGAHDAYVKFTAPEAGTYVIAYTSGSYLSDMPSSAVKDGVACTYTLTMAAGESFTFNPWATNASKTYTYTIALAPAVEEPEQGEDEGGDAGESAGAVTYIGSNGSRGMMIVIDKENDTMVITRAQSGSLTNFAGGTTYTFSYSATLALANANGGTISGTVCDANNQTTAIMNLSFNADGEVVSLAWNGQAYTNYVKQ